MLGGAGLGGTGGIGDCPPPGGGTGGPGVGGGLTGGGVGVLLLGGVVGGIGLPCSSNTVACMGAFLIAALSAAACASASLRTCS